MFFKYLKSKRRTIFMPFLFAAVFAVIFYLYSIPVKAIIYPLFLTFFLGIIILFADYYSVYKKYSELKSIEAISAKIIDSLPSSDCVLDDEYREIIKLLVNNQKQSTETLTAKYEDMINYYTVWAHQIKTPIAAMRLNLQNEDSENARRLRSDLTRIENYVEMVLAFLRLDSPDSDYIFKEYDLDKIIKDAVRKFSSEFISKKLSFSFEETKLNVLTDEKWLSFAIEQILSNSLKYTEKGGVRIHGADKTLCIDDSGRGIPACDLPRIFEKGYTGAIGREDKKASGLGLYLTKRICDNLGHKISVESQVDVGTTVKINLEAKNFDIE